MALLLVHPAADCKRHSSVSCNVKMTYRRRIDGANAWLATTVHTHGLGAEGGGTPQGGAETKQLGSKKDRANESHIAINRYMIGLAVV